MLCVRKGPESVETTLMTFPSLGPSPEPWANGCIPVLWCNLYKKQLSPFHRCRNQGSQSFSQLLDNDRAGFASPHTCPALPAGIISPSPSPVCFFPWSMLVCVCGGVSMHFLGCQSPTPAFSTTSNKRLFLSSRGMSQGANKLALFERDFISIWLSLSSAAKKIEIAKI